MYKILKLVLMTIILSSHSFAKNEFAAAFGAVHTAHCIEDAFNYQSEHSKLLITLKAGTNPLEYAGFRFDNESQTSADFFKILVNEEITTKLSKHQKFENIINDARTCHDIKCALTILFKSEEILTKASYLFLKYGLNISPYSNRDAYLLDSSDLDTILVATRLIPNHMLPIWKNKRLAKHIKEDIGYYETFMIYANASIDLYTPWFKELDNDGKSYSIFHEFSHNLSYMMNFSESKKWLSLSKWLDTPNGWRYDHSKMVSEYAESSPSEDAAESILAYRINPELLKVVSRQKYDYIRDYIFLGEEFDNSKSCGKTPVLTEILAVLNSKASEEVTNKSLINCDEELAAIVLSKNEFKKFDSCMQKSLKQELIKNSNYPHFTEARESLLEKLTATPQMNTAAYKQAILLKYQKIQSSLREKATQLNLKKDCSVISDFTENVKDELGKAKFTFAWDLRSYCTTNQKLMKKKGLIAILEKYLKDNFKRLTLEKT